MPLGSRSNFSQQSDEALLHQVAQHSAAALALLYARHAPAIFDLAAYMLGDPAQAAEVVLGTFGEVWAHATHYRGRGPAAAWMFQIARRRALEVLRRGEVRRPALAPVTAAAATDLHRPRDLVRRALAALPEDQRVCLELAYFAGLGRREIAEETRLDVGTIDRRIRLGLEMLERLLHSPASRDRTG